MIHNKFLKTISIVLILTLLIMFPAGSLFGMVPDWSPDLTRFSGLDRYDTSALVSSYLFKNSDYVVIARGDAKGNYADALAGSYLAGYRNAPILLTSPNSLPDPVRDEIIRLGAKNAYILGGTAAISQNVEDALKGMGLEVLRLKGDRREETAISIVNYVRGAGSKTARREADFAFIINGRATADALVAGSYSYSHGIPILLVNANSLPDSTGVALSNYDFDFLDLIGGTGVISANLESLLNSSFGVRQRISGADRYLTSTKFAELMFPGSEHFVFVAGPDLRIVDGISAAAFGLPILYVRQTSLPTGLPAYLNKYMSAFSHLFILGGTNAISGTVADQILSIQSGLPPMITYAYIESEHDCTVYAEIDNVNNTITLNIDAACAHDQFISGYSNLSKAVHIEVSNTSGGAYDLPAPGRLVAPDEDFIEIILDLFTDNPPTGVNAQTLLANSGATFKLTAADDPASIRTYTLIIHITDL